MVDFIDYLNRLIELNDPTVTILVSSNKENYDYIDKKIKTKVSNSIYFFLLVTLILCYIFHLE